MLWFGTAVKDVPKPPKGISKPQGPKELEASLKLFLTEPDRELIEVIVLDCSS